MVQRLVMSTVICSSVGEAWREAQAVCCRCCFACLQAEEKAGNQVDHPGAMLFSFLKRFGVDWDLNRDAVAVAQGGIVTRASLATNAGPFAGEDKLAVKDPLTGIYQTDTAELHVQRQLQRVRRYLAILAYTPACTNQCRT